MKRDFATLTSPPRPVRWDVRAQILLWTQKWTFLVLVVLAPLVAVALSVPYRGFRLAFSKTAAAPAQVSVYQNHDKYRSSSYHYTFAVKGAHYSSGGSGSAPSSGTAVYVVSRPDINRLEGHSDGFFSFFAMSPLLALYAATLYWLHLGLRRQQTTILLLTSGECATAAIANLDVTEEGDEKRKVYHMNYTFTPLGASEPLLVSLRTRKPNGLGDEHQEDIVFAPHDPEHPIFLDTLPGTVTWSQDEGWVTTSMHLTAAAVLLPIVAFLALLRSFLLFA